MKAVKLSLMTAFALATLVALAPVSRAQENKDDAKAPRPPAGQRQRRAGGAGGAAGQFDRFATQLKLTDEQKTKLQPIFTEEQTKLRELRQDTSLSTEQRQAKAKDVREQYLGKMKPILTQDQLDQLKKQRAQGPGRAPRGPRSGSDAGQPPATEKKAP